jgi:hypothetical protein
MEEAIRVWQRKILRKVYRPKSDTNRWTIGTNKELQDQYRSADIVTSLPGTLPFHGEGIACPV